MYTSFRRLVKSVGSYSWSVRHPHGEGTLRVERRRLSPGVDGCRAWKQRRRLELRPGHASFGEPTTKLRCSAILAHSSRHRRQSVAQATTLASRRRRRGSIRDASVRGFPVGVGRDCSLVGCTARMEVPSNRLAFSFSISRLILLDRLSSCSSAFRLVFPTCRKLPPAFRMGVVYLKHNACF